MKIRVMSSEVECLQEENSSLNSQLEDHFQEIKSVRRKQQKLFDDMTMAKSREKLLEKELNRFSDVTTASSHQRSHDYRKSPSHPDFTRKELMNVKRTNSDRT